MSQYEALDRLILQRLAGEEGVPLLFLDAREVREESVRIAKETGRDAFRVVDGRLQALRKAGTIVHDRKLGWRLA